MRVSTAMRTAFEQVKVAPSAFTEKGKAIAQNIQESLRTGKGLNNVPEIHVNLTGRTFRNLSEKGELPASMMH